MNEVLVLYFIACVQHSQLAEDLQDMEKKPHDLVIRLLGFNIRLR